ncbi:hypothetical protein MGN70_003295 [Eutypa lata]|uniref:LysM domain-containing protein n=1 Tax=Eutypa lata (strain UCR-EL1) TaxID=1287681 RepID=M7SA95_EUTLA|nr:hypothetical protein UCREL1_9991 [Eutypa lata UCREL1]KAI1255231.1 hypothetical protein MGN70_003295 [Eutypa lata]
MVHLWNISVLTLCLSGVLAQEPTQPGALDNCGEWTKASAGDTCESIADSFHMSTKHFHSVNPQLKGPCNSLLWAGYWYCVKK